MKGSRVGLVALAAMAVVAGWGIANAQHEHQEHAAEAAGHSHEKAAAHGGDVSMTREFHFETVFSPSEIRLYAYDRLQNPMHVKHWRNGLINASVSIGFPGSTREPVQLQMQHAAPPAGAAASDHSAHAQHAAGGSMTHDEPMEQAEHTMGHEAMAAASPLLWVCPMHPDENGRAAGKCTKCGMDFTPQDYLVAKISPSDSLVGEGEVTITLTNLPGNTEKRTTLSEKVTFAAPAAHESHDMHGMEGHGAH